MQQSRLNQMETADNAEDNPALSNVIERNIRTIIHLRLEAARERGLQDRIADVITSDDLRLTGKIAWAHLKEFPDYYTRLDKLEAEADKFWTERRRG